MTRLWLLDFDGTLVDSEIAIKACYLKVAQEIVPERSDFIKTMVIGPTLDESSKMILTNEKLHLHDTFKKRFQQLYDDKLLLETPQYPMVNEVLKILHNQGDHLCILTNKRYYPTHKLINYYGWDKLFSWVACLDEYPCAINKSDILRKKNIRKNNYSEIYFVGDTLNDGLIANEHKISFIFARYGYGKKQNFDLVNIYKSINKFEEILDL